MKPDFELNIDFMSKEEISRFMAEKYLGSNPSDECLDSLSQELFKHMKRKFRFEIEEDDLIPFEFDNKEKDDSSNLFFWGLTHPFTCVPFQNNLHIDCYQGFFILEKSEKEYKPIGIISFNPKNENKGGIYIRQFQPYDIDRLPKKWKQDTLKFIYSFSKRNSIPNITLQSAENNFFVQCTYEDMSRYGYKYDNVFQACREDIHLQMEKINKMDSTRNYSPLLSPAAAFLTYDVTARRFKIDGKKFELDENRDYVLNL
jgi:hypothetical protein